MISLDQVVVIDIEDWIIERDISMDKNIEKGHNMVGIIEEETLGEEIIKQHKITAVKPLEGNIEVTMWIVILMGVEAGHEIDNIQVILRGMIEVVLGQDKI